jgi:hypothetical protein
MVGTNIVTRASELIERLKLNTAAGFEQLNLRRRFFHMVAR